MIHVCTGYIEVGYSPLYIYYELLMKLIMMGISCSTFGDKNLTNSSPFCSFCMHLCKQLNNYVGMYVRIQLHMCELMALIDTWCCNDDELHIYGQVRSQHVKHCMLGVILEHTSKKINALRLNLVAFCMTFTTALKMEGVYFSQLASYV